MENHLDDRSELVSAIQIVEAIVSGWKLILGTTLVVGGLALIISLVAPKQYEATAIVAIKEPETTFQFDPRIQTDVGIPPDEGLTELAVSEDILANAIRATSPESSVRDMSVWDLRPEVEAHLQGDFLQLTVTHSDPTAAASLSNAWAQALEARIEDVYAIASLDIGRFDQQTEEAMERWEEAQDALVAFQERNEASISRQRLISLQKALATIEHTRQNMRLLIFDIGTASAALDLRNPSDDASLRDSAMTFILSLRVLRSSQDTTFFQSTMDAADELETEFVNSDSGSTQLLIDLSENSETVAEQQEYLALLESRVLSQLDLLDSEALEIETGILHEQARLEQFEQELNSLVQDVALARDVYDSLARKQRETELATEQESEVAVIAAQAIEPKLPSKPRILRNTILGAFGGIWLGIIILFTNSLAIERFRD